MKLAAIINVWDGEELFAGAVKCIKDHVDLVVVIWQTYSNFGERHDPHDAIVKALVDVKCQIHIQGYIPLERGGMKNERTKRDIGLDIARGGNCTHFIFIDTDEYYEDFGKLKQLYIESGKEGSYSKLYTYFKKPTLRFENPDNYFVPLIHKLKDDTVAGVGTYPVFVDPTRKVVCKDYAELPIFMHHFSWVRKDVERKARNSSAVRNIQRTTLVQDCLSDETKAGSLIRDYQNMHLIEVPNQFNIQI